MGASLPWEHGVLKTANNCSSGITCNSVTLPYSIYTVNNTRGRDSFQISIFLQKTTALKSSYDRGGGHFLSACASQRLVFAVMQCEPTPKPVFSVMSSRNQSWQLINQNGFLIFIKRPKSPKSFNCSNGAMKIVKTAFISPLQRLFPRRKKEKKRRRRSISILNGSHKTQPY